MIFESRAHILKPPFKFHRRYSRIEAEAQRVHQESRAPHTVLYPPPSRGRDVRFNDREATTPLDAPDEINVLKERPGGKAVNRFVN